VLEDPLRDVGSRYCYTFFEITDGGALAFFEHLSLVHPKRFSARGSSHHCVALEVEGDAKGRQLKGKLDAAGVASARGSRSVSFSTLQWSKRFGTGMNAQHTAFVGVRAYLAEIGPLDSWAVAALPTKLVAGRHPSEIGVTKRLTDRK
jgi:hypothetical protein